MVNVSNDKAFIISKHQINDKEEYITSLYNYNTNEIKSCINKTINKELKINERNICSSLYNSIVIIALRDREIFLYFNCESIENFERLDLDDDNQIRNPIDSDFELLPISGIQFTEFHLEDYSPFSNIITFFGNDTIIINSIYSLSKDIDEPFPYQHTPYNEIELTYDDIKDLQIISESKPRSKHKRSTNSKDIDVNQTISMNKTETTFNINIETMKLTDEDKVKFVSEQNLKSPTDLQFLPFIFDFSSHYDILIIYNETNEQIETYDIKNNFFNKYEKRRKQTTTISSSNIMDI